MSQVYSWWCAGDSSKGMKGWNRRLPQDLQALLTCTMSTKGSSLSSFLHPLCLRPFLYTGHRLLPNSWFRGIREQYQVACFCALDEGIALLKAFHNTVLSVEYRKSCKETPFARKCILLAASSNTRHAWIIGTFSGSIDYCNILSRLAPLEQNAMRPRNMTFTPLAKHWDSQYHKS